MPAFVVSSQTGGNRLRHPVMGLLRRPGNTRSHPAARLMPPQDRHGVGRQRDYVRAARLRDRGRHRPHAAIEVEIRPCHERSFGNSQSASAGPGRSIRSALVLRGRRQPASGEFVIKPWSTHPPRNTPARVFSSLAVPGRPLASPARIRLNRSLQVRDAVPSGPSSSRRSSDMTSAALHHLAARQIGLAIVQAALSRARSRLVSARRSPAGSPPWPRRPCALWRRRGHP